MAAQGRMFHLSQLLGADLAPLPDGHLRRGCCGFIGPNPSTTLDKLNCIFSTHAFLALSIFFIFIDFLQFLSILLEYLIIYFYRRYFFQWLLEFGKMIKNLRNVFFSVLMLKCKRVAWFWQPRIPCILKKNRINDACDKSRKCVIFIERNEKGKNFTKQGIFIGLQPL